MPALKRYVAMLRGINLGSHNRVAMPALRDLFEALGFDDVSTYVQSGNVVFTAGPKKDTSKLAADIGRRIKKDFGLDVTVVVRTASELKKVLGDNPFLAGGKDPTTLHVTFLTETPATAKAKALTAEEWPPDSVKIKRSEVYLHCPNGYGRTKLQNAFLEKRLGTRGTTRNWKTVTKLAELASG
ncbi:MAG: hypothetical protein JWP02_1629 [Acidimicrobiales bacterium]|nr:hypothetical protein [Acidimicrobiales bacterium]